MFLTIYLGINNLFYYNNTIISISLPLKGKNRFLSFDKTEVDLISKSKL